MVMDYSHCRRTTFADNFRWVSVVHLKLIKKGLPTKKNSMNFSLIFDLVSNAWALLIELYRKFKSYKWISHVLQPWVNRLINSRMCKKRLKPIEYLSLFCVCVCTVYTSNRAKTSSLFRQELITKPSIVEC